MLSVKIKAMLILTALIVAVGVPLVYYSYTLHTPENLKPEAVINAPSTGYVNTPITFSAKNSSDRDGFIVSYVWDFGDGHKSAGKFANHTYLEVGNFTVTLTVYDNGGDKSIARKNVWIKPSKERTTKATVDEILSEPGKYMGQEVLVVGVFAYGRNYSFYIVNESGYRGLRVYVEPNASRPDRISYGDRIEVLGRFTIYRNELELKVENNGKDYVIILGHGSSYSYKPINLQEWKNYNNSLVKVRGVVENVLRSYKYAFGDIWVYVSYNASYTGTPAIGDVFEVSGFLTYYYSSKYKYGYMEIYVRNSTEDYSRYISSNYTDANFNDILADPEDYNNTAIHLQDVDVVEEYASWSFYIGNDAGKMKVYVEKGGETYGMIFNGAKLDIWGTLSYYKGEWEIKVRNATEDKIVVKNKPVYQDVPVEVLLNNPESYNGSNVHSWGIISWDYQNESSGLILFGLFHNGSEITVVGFSGSNVSGIKEGYYADVYGEFTSYNNSWEIKIRPDSYDYVYSRPQSYQDVNITDVLNNASKYNNTLVHIPWAVVVSVYDPSWLFWVSNSTTSTVDMSVYVEKGASVDDVFVGAKVEIWAQITQYKGEWEFKIRNGTNDTVVVLNKINYVNVTIEKILDNESKYNNTNVHVPNATVVSVYASWLFWVSNSTDNSQDIGVYVEPGVNVPTVGKGDVIEIYGNVTYHNGSYEIKIRSGTPDRIIVIHSSARYVNFSYIHEVDSNGVLVHLGEQIIVNGTVIVPPSVYSYTSSSGTNILKFYIEGRDGGVQVFGFLDYSKLNLSEGDVVKVRGTLDQYYGEAELKVSGLEYITLINHTTPVTSMKIETGVFSNWSYAEKIEGSLVKINGTVTDKYVGSSFVKITVDDGSGGAVIFIRNSWGISTTNISVGDNITVVGIVGQYDSSSPYTSGYEIFPRYQSDIVKLNTTKVNSSSKSLYFDDEKSPCNLEVIMWKRDTALTAEDT